MSKLINYVGYSRVNGVLKFRTASTEARVNQLIKLGDSEVNMTSIAIETTSKSEAAKYCLTSPFFANAGEEVFALFTANAKDENPFAKPKARVVKIKVPTKFMVQMTGARVEEEPLTAKEAAKIRAEFNAKVKAAYEAN